MFVAFHFISSGQFSERPIFQTYTKDELILMMKHRIGTSIVDAKAMEMIASKVAATSGDARKALESAARACDMCRRKMPANKLDLPPESLPLVKIPHARMAIRENNMKSSELIEALPRVAKAVLVIAVQLARNINSRNDDYPRPLTLGQVRAYCMDAFPSDPFFEDISDIKSTLEILVDSGLLQLSAIDKKRFSQASSLMALSMVPIQLDLQLEDVESAVEDDLLKQPFYERIRQRLGQQA